MGQITVSRSVIGSAGTELSSSNLQMSYTVGETFTSTLENNEIHTLGFQQSDRWFTAINELSSIDFELFPNPADNEISVKTSLNESFDYEVRDMMGRKVLSGNTALTVLRLDVSQLEEGKYYFVLITENGIETTKGFITIH